MKNESLERVSLFVMALLINFSFILKIGIVKIICVESVSKLSGSSLYKVLSFWDE